MKALLLSLIITCGAGLLGCSVSEARELTDSYESAIRQAVRIMGDAGKKARLGEIFRESMRGWREQASYSEVRNLVSSLRGVKRQIRIEVGNINMGTYRVVWIVESESEVRAISNVFSAGKLVQANVPKNAWGEFLKFLASRGRVSGCQSDLAVDDGSSYFGTIAADGMVQNFAVYGFVPVPRRSDDDAIYKKLAPCSEFVEAVYSLLPSGKLPEQGFHEGNIVTQFTQKKASTLRRIEVEEIKFLVGTSGSSKPLPGVEVILLSSGERSLGRTDQLGSLSVKTSVIRKAKARAVLFCAEYFFCGAVPVNPDLFEYSEKYIELAPLAVR